MSEISSVIKKFKFGDRVTFKQMEDYEIGMIRGKEIVFLTYTKVKKYSGNNCKVAVKRLWEHLPYSIVSTRSKLLKRSSK